MVSEHKAPVIWWIRRDLRLRDNQALDAARAHGPVIPLFIMDPVFWKPGQFPSKRATFLLAGLRALEADLEARGSRLIIRSGEPAAVLDTILSETGAVAIFAEEDYSGYARRRDAAVEAERPLHRCPGLTVFHPDQVLKPDGEPYRVYTPFSKAWRALPFPHQADLALAPEELPLPLNIPSEELPEVLDPDVLDRFPAGEAEAHRRLAEFVSRAVYAYDERRDRPDLEATSGLSPYLRFGMLSARQAAVAAREAGRRARGAAERKGAETWLNELIWREFFQAILYHFPHVQTRSFQEKYREMAWEDDPDDLAAWQEGRTGYPMVDAAMRQLRETGWMHNRTRMITASFLVKDLLVDWRLGERWFMQHLVDGDPAANNGGWQWSAGTGADAAPYFRIFNPISQSRKFDPHGAYIRRWVPELAEVPDPYIHEPWKTPPDVQQRTGFRPGRDYPEPILDHAWARQRALEVYRMEPTQ